MHACALVLIPGPEFGDVDTLVREAMAPHDEKDEWQLHEDEEGLYWRNPNGFWDWYQIGGRWQGLLSDRPDDDPAAMQECSLCNGTGIRDDEVGRAARGEDPSFTCNNCDGKGRRVRWPVQRPRHDGDVQDALFVSVGLDEKTTPYSFVVHGAPTQARHRHVRDADSGDEVDLTAGAMRTIICEAVAARCAAGYLDDRIVVVDYHS